MKGALANPCGSWWGKIGRTCGLWQKKFPVPSASEKFLNRPKFCYPFGVIVTDIAKIMLFLAIFN